MVLPIMETAVCSEPDDAEAGQNTAAKHAVRSKIDILAVRRLTNTASTPRHSFKLPGHAHPIDIGCLTGQPG